MRERAGDIAWLRRIAEGADSAGDRAELAARLRAYFATAAGGVSLDDAFGLSPASGRLPWWRADALARRDAVLRAMADRFHAGLPMRQQAAAIHAALRAYAASAWRFDRRRDTPPSGYAGTAREMLFDAMRASDRVLSISGIRRALSER